jgi:hypothetical protein
MEKMKTRGRMNHEKMKERNKDESRKETQIEEIGHRK